MLMILDGFGYREDFYGNAILRAKTPVLDEIFDNYPFITIYASGEPVGLPAGQMGNSEVGHLNIGAGSVIYQNLLKISRSIDSGEFFENEALMAAFKLFTDEFSGWYLEMIKPVELKALTGYLHGGTSPLGMKNQYRVIFDECAGDMETVLINGGGGGYLVELTLDEFAKVQPYELMPLKK